MSQNPLDRLEAIVSALRTVGDDENAAWLAQAAKLHLYDDVSLDVSLGLKGGSTGRSARFRRLRRDVADHLRTALQHCDGNLARLAEVVASYAKRRSWVCLPQAQIPTLQRAIAAAFATGLTVPQTGQGIGRLLRSEPELPNSAVRLISVPCAHSSPIRKKNNAQAI